MRYLLCFLALAVACLAQDPVSLAAPGQPNLGWQLGLGTEFPGAQGTLALDPSQMRGGKPSLKLDCDLTNGGNYVQAAYEVPPTGEIETIALWVRAPGAQTLGIRLVDSSGACHQIKLKIEKTDNWQLVRFDAKAFFNNPRGESNAGVQRYEVWGKSKAWSGHLNAFVVMTGRGSVAASPLKSAIWFADVRLGIAAGSEGPEIGQEIRLDQILQVGEVAWKTWKLGNPKGDAEVVKDQPEAGTNALRLHADFTPGGVAYAATKSLGLDGTAKVLAVKFRMKSDSLVSYSFRLEDGTGQTHQRKGLPFIADGTWRDVVMYPSQYENIEHWGGANDGKWHDPVRSVTMILTSRSAKDNGKQVEVLISGLRAEVSLKARIEGPAARENFEGGALPADWTAEGDVKVVAGDAFEGSHSLQLTRTESNVNTPCSVTGPTFPVLPGSWKVTGAAAGDVTSPDNSFQGHLALEILDANGKRIGSQSLHELSGKASWSAFSKDLKLPDAAAKARFSVSLLKTWGWFRVDDLQVAQVVSRGSARQLVDVIKVGGSALGNLFFPDDDLTFKATVQAFLPIPDDAPLTYVVTDYWGAEQGPAASVALDKKGWNRQAGRFEYEATWTVDPAGIELGKYYEVHASVAGTDARLSSFARLPEAITRQHKPEDVPFNIRNWDNRIPVYLRLADRLGFRQVGQWVRWKPTPPFKVDKVANLDICDELGLKWIGGLGGVSAIERDTEGWTDEAVYEGVKNFLTEYRHRGVIKICLGNEPHGDIEQIKRNVGAYEAAYRAAKEVAPEITVVGTSNPPDKRYFDLDYQQYCDVYDFHVYEDPAGIRKQVEGYVRMGKEYNAPKPVISTEIGLNSQGMSRAAVAADMVKKFAAFFAAGGAEMAWFTIMYPDPKGLHENGSGQAHNTFYCAYNLYCPKLDGIMLYNLLNGICVKKFAEEKVYGDNHLLLFRDGDGQCLIMAWKKDGTAEVKLALPGVESARVVRIDGSSATLTPADGAIALRLSSEPVLILASGPELALPAELPAAPVTLAGAPASVPRGNTFQLKANGAAPLRLVAPPGWQVAREGGSFSITVPATTEARVGRLYVQPLDAAGAPTGDLSVPVRLTGQVEVSLLPVIADGQPAVRVKITNHEPEPATLSWELALESEFKMAKGQYQLSAGMPPEAYFASAQNGSETVAGAATNEVVVPIAKLNTTSLYRVRAIVTSPDGRQVETARYISGFATAPRLTAPLVIDGKLDETDWQNAPAIALTEDVRYFRFPRAPEGAGRTGTEDLSGDLRFLWDDHFLYLSADVLDDVMHNPMQDSSIWNQDSVQLLVDPNRMSADKGGYYDYGLALGAKGPQAWCFTSGDPAVMAGEVPSIKLAVTRDEATHRTRYEAAIPWERLRPFVPAAGHDLGLTMILNEDDGPGREGFFGWFSGAHSKQLDQVGDIILKP